MRPNGNLLVAVQSGANGNSVAEFDTSGNYLGNFVAIGSGGLDGPFDVYPRTTDWLVPSINTDNVLRYDVAGAPLGVFAPSISSANKSQRPATAMSWSLTSARLTPAF